MKQELPPHVPLVFQHVPTKTFSGFRATKKTLATTLALPAYLLRSLGGTPRTRLIDARPQEASQAAK